MRHGPPNHPKILSTEVRTRPTQTFYSLHPIISIQLFKLLIHVPQLVLRSYHFANPFFHILVDLCDKNHQRRLMSLGALCTISRTRGLSWRITRRGVGLFISGFFVTHCSKPDNDKVAYPILKGIHEVYRDSAQDKLGSYPKYTHQYTHLQTFHPSRDSLESRQWAFTAAL